MRKTSSFLLMAALAACASDTKDGLPVQPPFADGKADVGDRVTDRGPLGYGEDAAVQGEITEDLEFHGYTLSARAGAILTLDVTQRGSSRGVDTTLFVYGPRGGRDGGFGTSAIATDDDSGWGRLSRLRSLELEAGGVYLVVVGTHDARGRGRYRLEARCESGDCGTVAPVSGACHDALATAITTCIDDYVASEPEWFYSMTRRDLIEQCADAEVIAPAWDALCASASAPAALCALSIEEVSTTVLPTCRDQVWNGVLDAQCVFGDRYRDLFGPGAIAATEARRLDATSTLSSLEAAQLVAAVQHAYTEASTVEAAFGSVDEGLVNQTQLWDASNRLAFTAYEYGAGDNSYGLIFRAGTTDVAARINDGDLYGCTTTWGPEMRDCASDASCAAGLGCEGIASEIGRGRCMDTSAAPETVYGTFVTRPDQPIPDGAPAGVEATLVAYGLATVDVEVKLDLVVSHPRIRDLRVSLINPDGTEAIVFDRERDGAELYLDDFVVTGFSGDEAVNGVWRLRAVDAVSGRSGTIGEFGLAIASRWD